MQPLQLATSDSTVIAVADTVKATLDTTIDREFGKIAAPLEEVFGFVPKVVIDQVLKILLVFVIYLIGRWLIRKLVKVMGRMMERRAVDLSLRSFLISLVRIGLYVTLIILLVGILGIDTTSFIALFASAGLAIGMALSGALQNFAGGVMILLVRPFRVGDTIEAQGQVGTVSSIQLTYTILSTADNQTVYLPNGPLSTGIIKRAGTINDNEGR